MDIRVNANLVVESILMIISKLKENMRKFIAKLMNLGKKEGFTMRNIIRQINIKNIIRDTINEIMLKKIEVSKEELPNIGYKIRNGGMPMLIG